MTRWLMVAALAAGACSRGPSAAQCKQLLEHLIDLEFKKAGAAGAGTATDAMKADITKQKAAVASAKSAEFVSVCVDKTAKSRVECALAANDLDAVAKCDEQK